MEMVFGYLAAVCSSFFFTSFVVQRKFSKLPALPYTISIGAGYLFVSFIMYGVTLFRGTAEAFWDPILLVSVAAGAIWMLATFLLMVAIDRIGLSRANQWKTLQGPIGAFLLLIVFAEHNFLHVAALFVAILSFFLSAVLFTISKDKKQKIDTLGVICGFSAAFLFAVNAFMKKFPTDAGFIYVQQIYTAVGVLVSGLIWYALQGGKFDLKKALGTKSNYRGVVGGSFYYFASFLYVVALSYIPGSIAFTLVQLNLMWTILIGIFFFKEINFKKYWLRLSVGVALSIFGIFFLLLAQK